MKRQNSDITIEDLREQRDTFRLIQDIAYDGGDWRGVASMDALIDEVSLEIRELEERLH